MNGCIFTKGTTITDYKLQCNEKKKKLQTFNCEKVTSFNYNKKIRKFLHTVKYEFYFEIFSLIVILY